MRILLVSQMYPGPDAPDLGTFVAQVERELVARGNEVERAVLDTRAGGKLRYLTLARRTIRASRPDVVYAHFLVPAGLIAALAGRAPLVVTAHGRDVRNIGAIPGVAVATRFVVNRAETVICVSNYLRCELETKLPEAQGKVEVVSSGVDRERFSVTPARSGPPGFLCVGALDERENVVRLADAFGRLRAGTLTFAGRRASPFPARGTGAGSAARSTAANRRGPGRLLAEAGCSRSRASWSRSARRCSRRWRAAARSWRPGSADRPSSSPPKPACSSIRSTSTTSLAGSSRPRLAAP